MDSDKPELVEKYIRCGKVAHTNLKTRDIAHDFSLANTPVHTLSVLPAGVFRFVSTPVFACRDRLQVFSVFEAHQRTPNCC